MPWGCLQPVEGAGGGWREPGKLHQPLRAAAGDEGSMALWMPAPRLGVPQRTPLRLRAGDGLGALALKAGRRLQGGSQATSARRTHLPVSQARGRSPQPPGALPKAVAQGRLAEQDGCPARGERERSRLRGQQAGASGGAGETGPGCPVSTGPFSAPPASVGAGCEGRGMSPPGAERGSGSPPPGPGRHPGQGAPPAPPASPPSPGRG